MKKLLLSALFITTTALGACGTTGQNTYGASRKDRQSIAQDRAELLLRAQRKIDDMRTIACSTCADVNSCTKLQNEIQRSLTTATGEENARLETCVQRTNYLKFDWEAADRKLEEYNLCVAASPAK